MGLENVSKDKIIQGIRKSFDNAVELLSEADILSEKNKWARAYTLCQLAIEELAKITLLFNLLIDKINGYPIDYSDCNTQFMDHALKTKLSIETEMFFFQLYKKETGQDWIDNVIKKGEEFISKIYELNDLKNESLYVSIIGNTFQSPNEIISKEAYDNIRATAILRKIMFDNFVKGAEKNIEEIARIIKEKNEKENGEDETS